MFYSILGRFDLCWNFSSSPIGMPLISTDLRQCIGQDPLPVRKSVNITAMLYTEKIAIQVRSPQ